MWETPLDENTSTEAVVNSEDNQQPPTGAGDDLINDAEGQSGPAEEVDITSPADGRALVDHVANEFEYLIREVQDSIGDVKRHLQGILRRELQSAFEGSLRNQAVYVHPNVIVAELDSVLASAHARLGEARNRLQGLLEVEVVRAFRAFEAAFPKGVEFIDEAWPAGDGVEEAPAPQPAEAGLNGYNKVSASPNNTAASGEVYEGPVLIKVESNGQIVPSINFLTLLRRKSELRLLKVKGNPTTGDVDVLAGLREPVDLQELLRGMEWVREVRDGDIPEGSGVQGYLLVTLATGQATGPNSAGGISAVPAQSAATDGYGKLSRG